MSSSFWIFHYSHFTKLLLFSASVRTSRFTCSLLLLFLTTAISCYFLLRIWQHLSIVPGCIKYILQDPIIFKCNIFSRLFHIFSGLFSFIKCSGNILHFTHFLQRLEMLLLQPDYLITGIKQISCRLNFIRPTKFYKSVSPASINSQSSQFPVKLFQLTIISH